MNQNNIKYLTTVTTVDLVDLCTKKPPSSSAPGRELLAQLAAGSVLEFWNVAVSELRRLATRALSFFGVLAEQEKPLKTHNGLLLSLLIEDWDQSNDRNKLEKLNTHPQVWINSSAHTFANRIYWVSFRHVDSSSCTCSFCQQNKNGTNHHEEECLAYLGTLMAKALNKICEEWQPKMCTTRGSLEPFLVQRKPRLHKLIANWVLITFQSLLQFIYRHYILWFVHHFSPAICFVFSSSLSILQKPETAPARCSLVRRSLVSQANPKPSCPSWTASGTAGWRVFSG